MTFEIQSTLRDIVARASFIGERRAPEFMHDLSDTKQTQTRFDAWLDAVSEDRDRAALDKLWAWDEIDETAAREMVAPVAISAKAPLPRWAEILQVTLSDPSPAVLPEGVIVTDEPLAFQELLLPLVMYAQREFQASPGYDLLSEKAQAQLGRSLLKMLIGYAAEPLFLEFQAMRNRQPFGGLGALVAKSSKTPKDTLYQKFVSQMREGGFIRFLSKYPVLARILGTFTQLNIETRIRFLKRLAEDTGDIARVFNGGAPLAQVESLALSLSDLHRGGDSVTAVTWAAPLLDGVEEKPEAGLHLVYKPKDLATEVAFNDLLQWIHSQSGLLELMPLTVINRGTHGWVTFAEHTACADGAAVARYYRRVGMLLALMYALEATDCHYENLIAAGEYPVLIDHETLFHHRVPEETTEELRDSAIVAAVEEISSSVMRIGLLPGWTVAKDKRVVYDASGLGGYGGQRVPFHRPRFLYPNTDAMELKLETGKLQSNPNIPEVDGAPARLEDYKREIVGGFRDMYEFLLDRRVELLDPDGPLSAFREAQVRFVFRATQVYASLQRQAQQPAFLRDGALYSIYIERLARAFLQLDDKPSSYPLLAAERHDMGQLDTPFFTARTDSADLHLDINHGGEAAVQAGVPRVLRNYFTGPSFDLARERIQKLSQIDLTWQVRLIETSLDMRFAEEGYTATLRTGIEPVQVVRDANEVDLVAAALDLGEELRANRTLGKDGSATWLGPAYMPESGRYQLSITGMSTYDGLPGVGLFAAALTRVTGQEQWRELANGSFKFVREALKKETSTGIRSMGIGGAAGFGAVLYALSRTGMMLEDSSYTEDALEALEHLTTKHIQDDKIYDVIGGSAGGILSLLALYESTGRSLALERAREAGQHLLQSRIVAEDGHRVWRTIMAQPLTGFSHGVAGVALALFRLYRATGEEEFRAAAIEALEYEDNEFDSAKRNWYDLRDQVNGEPYDPAQPKYAAAWCHGGPGIGLARVGGLDIYDNAQMRADIDAALDTTSRALEHLAINSDHLCCGNVGRIELLWTAAEKLERPELKIKARAIAEQVVLNAKHNGGYYYSSFTPRGVFAPGLFIGGAGIGYQLLRFGAPVHLPNVLLWE